MLQRAVLEHSFAWLQVRSQRNRKRRALNRHELVNVILLFLLFGVWQEVWREGEKGEGGEGR